jgi:hypothetical protein
MRSHLHDLLTTLASIMALDMLLRTHLAYTGTPPIIIDKQPIFSIISILLLYSHNIFERFSMPITHTLTHARGYVPSILCTASVPTL